jgi:CMP-N-acetylneuraminic acid synthetase
MLNNKKILAIIPARGGSKRLPRKNILPLAGKPLIQWTIDAALSSEHIDDVIVSTDCSEIAKISNESGAKVPFIRPDYLSNDNATSNDVILHALKNINIKYDIIVLLQPTSPLRSAMDIDNAIELLIDKNAEGVVSVCPCEHSPLWANEIPNNLSLGDFLHSSLSGKRSQDLPEYFRLNGAVYVYHIDAFLRLEGIFYSDQVYAYKMPTERSVDIDNSIDFSLAEVLIDPRNN